MSNAMPVYLKRTPSDTHFVSCTYTTDNQLTSLRSVTSYPLTLSIFLMVDNGDVDLGMY